MSPTGGRRSATRNVFAIEDTELLLPNPVALDTSFVVEALIATQPAHSVCRPFFMRIVESGVSITTSDLLPVELAEAVFGIALKERWGSRWRRHRTDGRARRRAARLLDDTCLPRSRELPRHTRRRDGLGASIGATIPSRHQDGP
jgi:hypothetical protein